MEVALQVKETPKKWIYFLRQLMVCSGVWTTFFLVGQILGAPTVFVPQLRKDSAGPLDDNMISWLYSVTAFAAVPWTVILSTLAKLYGVWIPYTMSCIGLLVGYIIFYFSTTPSHILISELVFSIAPATTLTVGIIIVSEYTSPEYRGVFLTIKSASMVWGVWSANAIGTFFHWKNIAYSGFLCSAYTFTFIFWPESPQWLASKGKFDECREAYYWLRGHDEKSEREVEELIASKAERNAGSINNWRKLSSATRTIRSKQFYTPVLLIALLVTQYNFAGKLICAIYVIDILKKMADSEHAAYVGMLILDGVTVFSMYFGCLLTKILKRRTLYFTASFTGISFLFVISLYLYLVKLNVIEESKVLSIALLTCYSIAMGCGPMILSTSIHAELMPLRFKNVMVAIGAILFYTGLAILLKVTPYIFESLEIHGSFLFYGITASVCTLLLYQYLPETKDKTLQEIEQNFKEYDKSNFEMERLRKTNNYE